MEPGEWDVAIASLEDAADRMDVLGRCLGVVSDLRAWKQSGAPLNGAMAADALDQARGELERLASGQAGELLALVESLLDELPAPLE